MRTNYIDEYNRNNYKMFQFRVKKEDEAILNHLENTKNKNSYLISLINKDIHNEIYTIKEIKQVVKPIFIKYGIEEIYLFGSYARGDAIRESDIDIYCEKGDIKTFIDQCKLEEELCEQLNKKIDLIFIGSEINAFFKQQMMEDMIKLC